MTFASLTRQRPGLVILMLLLVAFAGGCVGQSGPGGDLRLVGHSEQPAVLQGQFDHAVYSVEDEDHITLLLWDGPEDQPEQAVTIRMFWRPRAGRTPIDATATNATMHYVVFADQQVGVYSGAGFVFPRDEVGEDHLAASVWDANLILAEATGGFGDLLGQSTLKGGLNARHDAEATEAGLRRLNQLIAERLGHARLVLDEPASDSSLSRAR